uniref:Amphiphysin n=1 Tax=Sphaeramia orbicularis TaxID=375764 RepID=A0A673AJ38_9TELE
MAEIKTGIFAKNVQKRLNRAQEKVLQKLGKADETKDEQFEQVVINFRRQESEGSRLQREMKSYMAAIKGMQQASINLSQSLHEVYEPDWHGRDDVMSIGKDCDALWEDFHNKVVDSTLLNLDAYLQQFPDLKTRVAKRSRKLIDYDSARHHVETLQASGMKNDRKMMKAEEELKKAQRVFDELNAGLQDELPTLWDNRVGFYINTYKSVTSLEARFHREISVLCKQLYEVMTKLGEQHSDKMFTIQGAPSDSGPLRLARTPSPPDDESPPESPDASSNHMLRPVSPGPPRPKSPSQLRKGPPVPPPPKVTPTKEVAEDQIIDLFGGEFLPAPSPSQPNERPGESLLDLDFDAFQPDESVSPIPQVRRKPKGPANGVAADWPQTAEGTPQKREVMERNANSNVLTETQGGGAFDSDPFAETQGGGAFDSDPSAETQGGGAFDSDPSAETQGGGAFDSDPSAETQGGGAFDSDPLAETQGGGAFDSDPSAETQGGGAFDSDPSAETQGGGAFDSDPSAETQGGVRLILILQLKHREGEKMPIPSVVIEPASSNEGDDDRDADIISPTAVSDNGVSAVNQTVKHMSPSGGVETMHDFEAANSDELELKRGDIVLVVPTASVEDQDAGWLTGIKESDWSTMGVGAQRGLFPENFTQRLE